MARKKVRFKVARHLGENVYGHPKALKRGLKVTETVGIRASANGETKTKGILRCAGKADEALC